jgi:hypothetical protein
MTRCIISGSMSPTEASRSSRFLQKIKLYRHH